MKHIPCCRNHTLHYEWAITTDPTVHNNRSDTVMLDKNIKETHSVDVAIPDSDKLHSTITKKLQVYTDLKHGLTNIWQLNAVCVVPTALSTKVIIQNKLHESLTLLILLPGLHFFTQKSATLNTRRLFGLLPPEL